MYLIEKYRVLILDIYKVCILMIISYFNIIWVIWKFGKNFFVFIQIFYYVLFSLFLHLN